MKVIDRVLEILASIFLFLTATITFLAVIMRYVFDSSLSWSFELLSILLTYITFISAYIALRKNQHLRIDVIFKNMSLPFQTVFFIFSNLTILGVTGVMIYWGFIQAFKFPGQVTEVMRIPISIIYLIIPLSGSLMFFHILLNLKIGITRVSKGLLPEI